MQIYGELFVNLERIGGYSPNIVLITAFTGQPSGVIRPNLRPIQIFKMFNIFHQPSNLMKFTVLDNKSKFLDFSKQFVYFSALKKNY